MASSPRPINWVPSTKLQLAQFLKIHVVYGDEFGERVLGNLINSPNFCTACQLACTDCRVGYGSFLTDITGVSKVPEPSNEFIDNPAEFLPRKIPLCDVILGIGIHPDLLLELPSLAKTAGAKAVIVPTEERSWCPMNLKRELESNLRELGVESAFPKPFCDLDITGNRTIDQFVRRYKIGRPSLEIELKGDMIVNAKVLRSAPCGSTWYVAEQLRWHGVQDLQALEKTISGAHHGYPCTGGMEMDMELNDTVLHKAGYIIREAVESAVAKARCSVIALASST